GPPGCARSPPCPATACPRGACREVIAVRPSPDADDSQLPFLDPTQYRYELIRPLLLCPERTATQRAQETGTHPETIGRLKRRFAQQGMLGLVPDTLDVHPAPGGCPTPSGTNPRAQKASREVWPPATWRGSFCIPPCTPSPPKRRAASGPPPRQQRLPHGRSSTTTAIPSASRPARRSLPSRLSDSIGEILYGG